MGGVTIGPLLLFSSFPRSSVEVAARAPLTAVKASQDRSKPAGHRISDNLVPDAVSTARVSAPSECTSLPCSENDIALNLRQQ